MRKYNIQQILRVNINLFLILFASIPGIVNAQVKLPRLISNGMVLQRNIEIPVWGWASPGEEVNVKFMGEEYTTKANSDKVWKVFMKPTEAGGPYTMEIHGKNHLTIVDILIGDVWICSGQSNMHWPMNNIKARYPDEIEKSENSKIRYFDVGTACVFQLLKTDVKSNGWIPANPENVLHFSAVGYFFARSLYEKYKVPIGLIQTSVGGTPIEAWMSKEALKAFPSHYREIKHLQDSVKILKKIAQEQDVTKKWFEKIQFQDIGRGDGSNPWAQPNVNLSDWQEMKVPGYFEQWNNPIDGAVWCRKNIVIPPLLANKKAVLYMGHVVDMNETFFNGVKVGETRNRYSLSKYIIPDSLVKPGLNIVTVRVINLNKLGGFVEGKPYHLDIDSLIIPLDGKWSYKIGVSLPPFKQETAYINKPMGLFNGKIAPLTNYSMKGVIWYQGESNVSEAAIYRKMFPALILDWRNKWNCGEFPFLFVQLANYRRIVKEPEESRWAELREAQSFALSVPKTGMAVAIDIGEGNDIHPMNKKDVGERLSLAAQKVAYGDDVKVYSGPIYQSMKVDGSRVYLTFDHIGSGLMAKGGGPLKYFSIAGDDGKLFWAKAEIIGNNVVVWSDKAKKPVAVRYAWADNPEGANLYNREGLPASPFRTDH